VQLQLTPVSLDEPGEGVLVAGPCPGDEIDVDDKPPDRWYPA
jgi:hypothetical protein